MKKTIAVFSSLLIFAGLKAQTPTVKKETVKPVAVQKSVTLTPDPTIKGAAVKPQHKISVSHEGFKKTSGVQHKDAPVQMKETPVAKPHKG